MKKRLNELIKTSLFKDLKSSFHGWIAWNQNIAPYTSYCLGGKVQGVIEPRSLTDTQRLMQQLSQEKIPYLILGGGSNVLFSDQGFQGIVIRLGKNFEWIKIEKNRMQIGAGTKLVKVMNQACKNKLGGFEFFAGIPGTIGGAVVGNAGAREKWIGKVVSELKIISGKGELQQLDACQYHYGYRTSSLKYSGNLLVEVQLDAQFEEKLVIEKKIREYLEERKRKQPRNEKNAGSVFKNPPGDYAARLIELVGLKGMKHGGAQISPVHSNFIVNQGRAKSMDVVCLMRLIQKKVFKKFGVQLEPEIIPMGDWNWEDIKDIWWKNYDHSSTT